MRKFKLERHPTSPYVQYIVRKSDKLTIGWIDTVGFHLVYLYGRSDVPQTFTRMTDAHKFIKERVNAAKGY